MYCFMFIFINFKAVLVKNHVLDHQKCVSIVKSKDSRDISKIIVIIRDWHINFYDFRTQ